MENGSRFSFDFAPYQREPFDEISNPENSVVVMALFSRGGKTEIVSNHIGYNIHQDPKRMIIAYPTSSQAEDWSKDNFEKALIAPTPELDAILPSGGGRRMANNTILSKSFPGGKLDCVGLNVAGKLRKLKAQVIAADEIDSISDNENDDKDEGDKISVLFKRGDEYPDTTKILTSYPSLMGRSRIWSWLERSDWRQWFVQHKCGHEYVMHRKDLLWDNDKPETARLVCPGCQGEFDDATRRKMVAKGEWRPTREFAGVRGYQANGMLWPHPHQKAFRNFLHQLATQEQNVKRSENPERALRVLVNTFDAEPFASKVEEKPDPVGIHALAEPYYPLTEIPAGALFLTAGADVNKHFIAVEIVAHGLNDETWGVHYEEIRGSCLQSTTWKRLDELLLKTWQHPLYGEMRPISSCIDSKYQSNVVKRWALQRHRRGIIPIVGSTTLGVPILRAKRKDPETGAEYWSLGTHEAKDLIYQRLELRPNEDGTFPQGYQHWPKIDSYGKDYFAGLLVENSSLKKADDGEWYRWFEKPNQGVRNEPLDCRVYAIAAGRILNPNFARLKENLDARAKSSKSEKPATPKKRARAWNGLA